MRALVLAFAVAALSGCASGGAPGAGGALSEGTVRAESCKRGDEPIADRNACLLDDAACYQLVTGGWCTGPRGAVCPAGSNAVPDGQACPGGAACFRMSESLECVAG